jgi:signal transduction histidine kinase
MIPRKGVWNSVWGGILAFFILVVPCLVGYDIYLQWYSPTMDFYLDRPGSSTVHSVVQGGHAEAAGLKAGDIILTVDDIPLALWFAPQIGRTHILKIERRGEQFSLAVPAVRVFQLNYLSLASAIIVVLAFWGIGTLLFVRRFWHSGIRLLFLLFQTIAITILFPLSFQYPWNPPGWLLSLSIAGFNLVAPLFFHYTITFPVKLGHTRQRFLGLSFLYGLVPVVLRGWLLENQFGMQISIFFFSLTVAASVTFLLYVYQYRASPDERRRSRIIVFGTLMAGTPPILFYLLPKAIGSPYIMPEWAAGLFLVIAPSSYLYVTLHYNLFGIDRLINRTLVYAILSLGIFIVYLGPYLFLYQYLPDDLFIQLAFIFGLTLWIGWTFDWIRTRAQRLADRLFYGGWYDYPTVVEMISDALARSSTRDQIFDVLANQVSDLMRLSSSYLWIGYPNSTFPAAPPMQARFRFKFQADIPAQWTVGLHRDGDDLSDADHRILHTLAQQAEIALNNAFMIETLRRQLDEIRASRETLAQTQHQLLRSREEERSRLARDLHDSPIQSLVGLNIQLGLLMNEKDLNISAIESLKEMRSEVRQLSSELRQVCADLRPPMLDTLGLGAALRALVTEWSDQYDAETELNLCSDASLRTLPGEVAVNLYRVAQEALVNIGKHAKARHIIISLAWEKDSLVMTIEDDGMGFTTPDTLHGLTAQSHFGLAGMRERVGLIGGLWSLKSVPGNGTIICVTWPAEREIL